MKRLFSVVAMALVLPLLAAVLGLFAGRDVVPTLADGTHPGLTPALVEDTIVPGDSADIEKTVNTPEIPPKPDIFFLFDTTGSMDGDIATVQAKLAEIIATVGAQTTDPQYGVAKYEDFPFSPWGLESNVAYQLLQAMTGDTTAVTTAINSLSTFPGSGGDIPEAGYEGLYQALTGAGRDLPNPDGSAPDGDFADAGELAPGQDAGFRAEASKVILLVGDAAFHLSGDPPTSLQFAAGYPGAGQADVLAAQGDVTIFCLIPAELEGVGPEAQCDALGATSFDIGTSSEDIAAAIVAALGEVEVEVSMATDCVDPISVSFAPASQVVTSGEHAVFTETISVAADAAQAQTYECDDWALIDGEPMSDASGAIILEHKIIFVPDVTPPEASCLETVNPHGKTVPPAGSTTLPGPKGGQNEDGFYQLLATDNVDPNPQIFVVDTGSGTPFGPFASGTNIKYTEDPTATPTQKEMGSSTDAVAWHIIGNGDAAVLAVDASGNVSDAAFCLVPPPPK